ncbi:MAG: dihydropteroate synthase, partial [Alphaproteobacteria bacterium]
MTLLTEKKPPLIMGILNVTSDSFSGDGLMTSSDFVAQALKQAKEMVRDGAAILDVGGESSRPGAIPIDVAEEIRRVVPVVQTIRSQFPQIPIAVDTVKSQVAREALIAGATIINDISTLSDTNIAGVAAEYKAYLVIMDNRSKAHLVANDAVIGSEYGAAESDDIVEEVKRNLFERITSAKAAGVNDSKIIIDPGIGFGKTLEQNLTLINQCDRFKNMGYPVLLGPSRKSFIGRLLDLPVDERLEGTAACVAIGALRGADILRVHDVKFMGRVAQM